VKFSESFLKFVEPLWEGIPELTKTNIDPIIVAGYTVWNAVVLNDLGITSTFLESIKGVGDPEFSKSVDMLIDRKKRFFKDDNRFIGKYEFSILDNENINFQLSQVDPTTLSFGDQ
jgi:hypothetical protein